MKTFLKPGSWALALGALAVGGFALFSTGASAQGSATKTMVFKMTSIRIEDEDDPLSNDEPYLINIGFRAKIQIGSGGKASIVPGTLSVSNVGSPVHNNLGRSGDNWADEVNTYGFNTQTFVAAVPRTEAGWAAGMVSVLFEEDGFSNSTAVLLRSKILTAVRTALGSLSVTGIDTNAITQAVVQKVTRDLSRAAKNFDIGGIIRGIASGLDPDDFGGVNIVMAVTLPGGSVQMFAGAPPASLTPLPSLTNVPANVPTGFQIRFPQGVPSSVPWNARYEGKCKVNGSVTQSG